MRFFQFAARFLLCFLLCFLAWLPSRAQPTAAVRVLVHPGTELLQIIHLLSDTAQVAESTYNAEVVRHFAPYRRHPAVLAARRLSRAISCDYPVRLSWAFYDFPDLKLATMRPEHLDGYEQEMPLAEVQAYFRQCLQFARDTRFVEFYHAHAPQYGSWVQEFEAGLKQQKLLETIDRFYRLPRHRPVALTLGVLNCGSYAMSDLRGINPALPNQHTVLVSYRQLVLSQDAPAKAPRFRPTAQTAQLVWHELGHTYLAPVFARHQPEINRLAYLVRQDPRAKQWAAARGGWSNFLNENVAQAVTNVLKLRAGTLTQAEALASDDFYIYSGELAALIEHHYKPAARYKNFEAYFPVLLRAFAKNHPATAAK
ncbi:DUF4932 domain-containing protein [Hymenobacter arizonensis]|uniref:DUF4932 domain-containing protein n=1 Tax=Hymenobacter arizonensis TaxID=1227077 RepID=A0A1I6BCU2_HYMAR|nr:DUF4932 domain-containing protein [Hymenobacter arizonensis]SFQ78763.1 protein of unknown function [Hymenobacter arizonensis]